MSADNETERLIAAAGVAASKVTDYRRPPTELLAARDAILALAAHARQLRASRTHSDQDRAKWIEENCDLGEQVARLMQASAEAVKQRDRLAAATRLAMACTCGDAACQAVADVRAILASLPMQR